MFDEKLLLKIWENARPIKDYDPAQVRQDACGAAMVFSYRDRQNNYAWEVDHIIPTAILEANNVPLEMRNNIKNLRALNWHNNVSKADDFPDYESSYILDNDTNIYKKRYLSVNTVLQKELLEFYKQNGYDIKL